MKLLDQKQLDTFINNFHEERKALVFKKEEVSADSFILDLEAFIKDMEVAEEVKELKTAEIYHKNITATQTALYMSQVNVVKDILNNEELKATYGNKVINNYQELIEALREIPVGNDVADIIAYVSNNLGCTYQQATTKLAVAFNINVEGDTWFKRQYAILEANRISLDDESLATINPKLYAKFKRNKNNRGARKYLEALLDVFQSQLELLGIFYDGGENNLIASCSMRFMKNITHTGELKTVTNNIANIASYKLTNKLSDERVKEINNSLYVNVNKLKVGGNTITTYELVEWNENLLSDANETIKEDKLNGKTNKGINAATLNTLGHDDVITKGTKVTLSEEDEKNIKKLHDWAYQKCFKKGRAGFFSLDEFKEQFGKDKINVGERKIEQYRIVLCARLGLVTTRATKSIMTRIGSKKALRMNCPQKTVFVPKTTIEDLLK